MPGNVEDVRLVFVETLSRSPPRGRQHGDNLEPGAKASFLQRLLECAQFLRRAQGVRIAGGLASTKRILIGDMGHTCCV